MNGDTPSSMLASLRHLCGAPGCFICYLVDIYWLFPRLPPIFKDLPRIFAISSASRSEGNLLALYSYHAGLFDDMQSDIVSRSSLRTSGLHVTQDFSIVVGSIHLGLPLVLSTFSGSRVS
jgi:hypothetical protein